MSEKYVTLIIPCHNSSKYLPEAFDSVRKQTLGIERMHIIPVDDASDDEGRTRKLIEDFTREFPDSVTPIYLDENLRQGGARNRALPLVDTEFLQFLDSDDTLEPEACRSLIQIARAEKADLVLFNMSQIEDDFRINLIVENTRKIFLSSHIWTANHNTKLYRSSLMLDNHLLFSEHCFFEEPLFVYPAFYYADSVVFLKKKLYNFRIHDQSTMSSQAAHSLLDHPKVQLQLLNLLKDRGFLSTYHDEIEEYFLWTYFLENAVNFGAAPGIITIRDFREIQDMCRKKFPDYQKNLYIQERPEAARKILSGITRVFPDQESLELFFKESFELSQSFS